MSKRRVFFFAADPLSCPPNGRNPRLQLDEDVRRTQEAIRAARYRDTLTFDFCLAARPNDLLRAMEEMRPRVVHFSGHGDSRGLVLVSRDGRRPQHVDGATLERLFRLFRGKVRVVVLNACFSLPQARAIANVVGCAIGTDGRLSDAAAITFGAEFYRALGFGRSVKAAFDQASVALEMNHREQRILPELVTGPGVDPARVYVVRFPRLQRLAKMATLPLTVGAVATSVFVNQAGADANFACGWEWAVPRAAAHGIAAQPLAMPTGGPGADLVAGKELARIGNHAEAFAHFKRAAEAGNLEAAGYLGTAYLRGLGTPRQPERGFELVHSAALRRDPRAMYELAVAYQNGDGHSARRDLARQWYQKAADEKGVPEAMRNLARIYVEEGRYGAAIAWYRRALRAGLVDAGAEAGRMYEMGQGLATPDPAEARCLYRASAEAGSAFGMFAMGSVYQNAVGVDQDLDAAREWYRKAAVAGSAEAMTSLGMIYQNGWGVTADRSKAIDWYVRAARLGSRVAAGNLRLLGIQ